MMQLTGKYYSMNYGSLKLTSANIVRVRVYTKNNIPYRWVVVLRENCMRSYGNFNEKGAGDDKPFPFEALPMTVKKYILKRTPVLINDEYEGYRHYEYK